MCPGNNTGNVHAFIMSQVDYCNSLLAGSPNYITDRQQRIVNAATGLVSGTCKFCHLCYIRSALVQRPRAYQLCVKLHVRDKRTQQTRLRQTRWWQDSLTARRLFLLRPVLHRSAQLLKIIVALGKITASSSSSDTNSDILMYYSKKGQEVFLDTSSNEWT